MIQLINEFILILSIIIGINLWLDPQISEHCPKYKPGLLIENLSWLIRPGEASIFIPRVGTVHAWITSEDETSMRIWVLKGIGKRLSTSKFRNIDLILLLFIYESISMFLKSDIS